MKSIVLVKERLLRIKHLKFKIIIWFGQQFTYYIRRSAFPPLNLNQEKHQNYMPILSDYLNLPKMAGWLIRSFALIWRKF